VLDLVLFSGDKLLGRPPSRLAIGDKGWIDKLKRNPLTRALRPDKLTLAGLEATLRLYRDEEEAIQAIPTLRMITQPLALVKRRAQNLTRRLRRSNSSRQSNCDCSHSGTGRWWLPPSNRASQLRHQFKPAQIGHPTNLMRLYVLPTRLWWRG